MIDLLDIRYVRLGTRDLAAADRFAREVVGLELARAEGGARYHRSDDRDHTLVHFEGDPRDHTVGFELRDAAQVSDLGRPAQRGGTDECEQRRVHGFVGFRDLTGNRIDLVVRPRDSDALRARPEVLHHYVGV